MTTTSDLLEKLGGATSKKPPTIRRWRLYLILALITAIMLAAAWYGYEQARGENLGGLERAQWALAGLAVMMLAFAVLSLHRYGRVAHTLRAKIEAADVQGRALLALIDHAGDGLCLVDEQDQRIIYANRAFAAMHGYPPGDVHLVVGRRSDDFVAPEPTQPQRSDGQPGAMTHVRQDGRRFPAEDTTFTVRDAAGDAMLYANITRRTDPATMLPEAAAEHAAEHADIQAAPSVLHAPVIPLAQHTLLMPLAGALDAESIQASTRALLDAITAHQAHIAILDVTGIATIDGETAVHLNRAIQGARLKGAAIILTGISSAVAETVIDQGIDWQHVTIKRDLAAGLHTALERLGLQITHAPAAVHPAPEAPAIIKEEQLHHDDNKQ